MAIYSFKIKKGIFQLDLSTSDKELVVEQFEKWVKEATAYAKKRKAKECKEIVSSQIKAEEETPASNFSLNLTVNNNEIGNSAWDLVKRYKANK